MNPKSLLFNFWGSLHGLRLFSFSDRDVEAALLRFVLDVYLPCPLVVEQHLPEHQFEVVFVHVVACARHLVIPHVREVKRRAVAVTGLRDRIDVAAALQVLDVLLRAEHGGDVEPVMRQAVALQYIRPLFAYRVQFALGAGDEVRHGVRQVIDDIVLVRLDLHQPAAHRCGIGTVFGRTRQTDLGSHSVLLGMQVVELDLIIERPAGIANQVAVLDLLFRFGLLRLVSAAVAEDDHTAQHQEDHHQCDPLHLVSRDPVLNVLYLFLVHCGCKIILTT